MAEQGSKPKKTPPVSSREKGTSARKRRLDELVVARGLADTRAKAQALIRAGEIFSGARRLDKPGTLVADDVPIERHGGGSDWVSRGGVKLAHGLAHFGLGAAGRVCLDVGASTGGFTQVLLAHGAARVYAVDVGRGQLDWALRNDPRVMVREGVNARYLTREHVPEPVEAIVCDVSFIGLETVLPAPLALAAPGCWLVALIKPQFEVGRGRVGRKGVVKDPALHREACERIERWLFSRPGWRVLGIVESPILGPEGNREFLIAAVYEA